MEVQQAEPSTTTARGSGIRLEQAYRATPKGWPEPQPGPDPWPTVCPVIGRLARRWHDSQQTGEGDHRLDNLMQAISASRQPEKEDLRARMVLQWLVAVAAPELVDSVRDLSDHARALREADTSPDGASQAGHTASEARIAASMTRGHEGDTRAQPTPADNCRAWQLLEQAGLEAARHAIIDWQPMRRIHNADPANPYAIMAAARAAAVTALTLAVCREFHRQLPRQHGYQAADQVAKVQSRLTLLLVRLLDA